MSQSICVFCASSDRIDPRFLQLATDVGHLLATQGHTLVYGGGKVGMMGKAAVAAKVAGGRVVGIIPEILMQREVAYRDADELVVTDDMFARKQLMIDRSDAFLVLPGGFGTLDEILEVITLKQLRHHDKPIYILNTLGFYDHMLKFFDQICSQHFARQDHGYYQVIDDLEGLAARLQA